MTQLFSRAADLWLRLTLLAVAGGAGLIALVGWAFTRSAYATAEGRFVDQPVPFSHAHHVGGLRIDCRYCHGTVEVSSFAGMPSTDTCMHCHRKVWPEAPVLEPVRESWRTGSRLAWVRVHDLPDFVFFDHSIHVAKGVGCTSCHGQLDRMPLTRRAAPLTMQWCLECHRHPEQHLRPREAVFDPDYQPPEDQEQLGRRLAHEYRVPLDGVRLTRCTVCHR